MEQASRYEHVTNHGNPMRTPLERFLAKFTELSKTDREVLASRLLVRAVKKNTILVRQGQRCDRCFFVLQGCLRQYLITSTGERTTAFYTEEQAVNYFSEELPVRATTNLSAVEDSTILVGDPERDKHLFETFPALAAITRRMVEQDLGRTQNGFAKFRTSSPEERYLDLLEEQAGPAPTSPPAYARRILRDDPGIVMSDKATGPEEVSPTMHHSDPLAGSAEAVVPLHLWLHTNSHRDKGRSSRVLPTSLLALIVPRHLPSAAPLPAVSGFGVATIPPDRRAKRSLRIFSLCLCVN